MSKRRPLTAGVNVVPDADPEAVRQFVTQERKPQPEKESEPELSVVTPTPQATATPAPAEQTPKPKKAKRAKSVTPVGLIPVTVRLRPDIAGALKRASLERQLAGEEPHTQQDLVELALEPWLQSEGYI